MYSETDINKGTNGHHDGLDALNERVSELRERLGSVDTQLRTMARERPVLVIGGAVLVGYLVGRIVSR